MDLQLVMVSHAHGNHQDDPRSFDGSLNRSWQLEELCFWLVGQGHPFEKYEPVNWDDDYSQDSWENKIDGNQTTNQCFQCCLIQLEDVNN